VSNLLAQRDTEWNRNMAKSQKTIAMLTVFFFFFLPATFFAVRNTPFYSSIHINFVQALLIDLDSFYPPLFNWVDPTKPVLSPKMWIYWLFTICFTALLFLCYFLWDYILRFLGCISLWFSTIWRKIKRTKPPDVEKGQASIVGGANVQEKDKSS
jgi:hypothetical protein